MKKLPTFSTADSSKSRRQRRLTAPWRLHWRLRSAPPTRHSHRSLRSLSPSLTTEPWPNDAKLFTRATFFSQCRIEALDPSNRGLNVGGSTRRKKSFEPSDNASDHDVFPITAVFGPSVAESRSSARVDGSQLHMRRDPAHSPIDRQRNASLLFPGLALTGTLCHIRLGLSCLFGTKNI